MKWVRERVQGRREGVDEEGGCGGREAEIGGLRKVGVGGLKHSRPR